MARLIEIPHTGGQINYEGEPLSSFGVIQGYNGAAIVLNYYGNSGEEVFATSTWTAPKTYRTRVRPGEMIKLMGKVGYSKAYRAAYPQGNKTEDDEALVFMESARFPTSEDGMIDLLSAEVAGAMTYFSVTKNYLTTDDVDRVLMGVEE